MKKKYLLFGVIITIIVALDQLTKYIITTTMTLGESIPVVDNILYITSHRNTGGAWGILADQMIVFYIITIIAFGLFLYLLKDGSLKEQPLYTIALLLMFAGGIGNFIDRLLFQEVVDFIDVYIGNYDFPIFNVADIGLTIGTAIFMIDVVINDVIKR